MKATQRAGINKAVADPMKYKGRKPSYDRKQLDAVIAELADGTGPTAIARSHNLTRQTVLRIRNDPAKAGQQLEQWGL